MVTSIPAASRSSNFGVDVLTLITGTSLAQIILIASSPIITRLYGPEMFGILALFTSITGIIGIISCLRYELAIVLPKSDKEAANIFALSIFFAIITCISTIPLLIIFQNPLLEFLKTPQLSVYMWLVPPTILVGGFFLALNQWNTRLKNFHSLSIARVISSSSSTTSQLIFGFSGYASGGILIGSSILGQIVSTIVLGMQIIRHHLIFFKQNISWHEMKTVFKRYINFPKYDIWSALLNTISWQIPIFLLSFFFSTTIVGYYSLGMIVIQLPMSFVGSAIAQVFFQLAVESKHDNSLSNHVESLFKILIIIGLFPILILTCIGQDIFSVVFGQIWGESGLYCQILGIWALIWFISSPLSMIYIALEKQDFGLKYNITNFFTRLGSLLIGGLLNSPIIALILFASSGIIVYGYLGITMLKYSNVDLQNITKIVIKNVLIFIPAGIILIGLKLSQLNSLELVIIGVILCIIYYFYVIKTDSDIKNLFLLLQHQKM